VRRDPYPSPLPKGEGKGSVFPRERGKVRKIEISSLPLDGGGRVGVRRDPHPSPLPKGEGKGSVFPRERGKVRKTEINPLPLDGGGKVGVKGERELEVWNRNTYLQMTISGSSAIPNSFSTRPFISSISSRISEAFRSPSFMMKFA